MSFTEMIDIKAYNNGLDVDGTVDKMNEKKEPEILKDFIKAASNLDFLVPYRDDESKICIYTTNDKMKMVPIFSCYEAFLKSPLDHEKANIMSFAKINEIITQSGGELAGILINPHGKSLTLKREAGNKGIKLSKAVSVPRTIPAALCGFFAATENVYRAFLLWAQKENELAPHLFLVVDFDGSQDELFPKIADAVKPFVSAGDKLEMAKADMKLLTTAEKIDKPFYKK